MVLKPFHCIMESNQVISENAWKSSTMRIFQPYRSDLLYKFNLRDIQKIKLINVLIAFAFKPR
uniref:Uncharacterized protein n=1 Tax=Parascaris univalens TaxID=6257 RepID=A0A914ZSE4_PARUN